ncbi:MAG: histidine phosphatase family protein [Dehalococcoidia bacterium]|nr:histidine phosphatase family protein [Dehalococcoidia bacterium]
MPAPSRPPTRIFVVRHGQTEGNRDGIFCGHGETRLTDLGRRQAAALGKRLAGIELHAVYTSDLSRAVETAVIALAGRGLEPRLEPALRELHYGEWELQRERAIARSHPEQFRLMRDEDPAWQPPGGETIHMVRERTHGALARIAGRHRNQNVLVVTHGTAINCMLSAVLGMAPEYTFRFAVSNCGLSEVRRRGRALTVAALNDTAHLAGLLPPAAAE